MALPKINESIKHEVIIPSSNKVVRFRPYLVKEEKILLQAFETNDTKTTLSAVVDTIESCIFDPISKNQLTTFDIEYLFLQIRGKSVGEKSEVSLTCSSCEAKNPYEIDVTQVTVGDGKKIENILKVTDNISVEMRYPSYKDISTNDFGTDVGFDALFDLIVSCMVAIYTDEERIEIEDEPKENVREFLESMTGDQLRVLTGFLDNMPKTSYDADFNCISCGEHNHYKIEGMQNFFS